MNIRLLPLVIAAGLLMVGCSEPKTVTIGFVGGLSGRVADLGVSGRNGVQLAVEQRNRAGGINGRQVKLVIKNDRQDAAEARRAVQELIDEKVVAIIGHMTSAMSSATVDLVNKNRLVMVSPTTTTDYLSGLDDYFFRVSATTQQYASKMAQYLWKERDLRKVAIIYDLSNSAYTDSWMRNFRNTFTSLGGAVVNVTPFTSGGQVNMLQLVRQVEKSHPDGLVVVAGALDTAIIAQQVHKLNLSFQIAASEWASTEQLLELGGVAVEGVTVSQFFDRLSQHPRYLAFREDYRGRFGDAPGFASVNAYDAANFVMDTLALARGDQSLKVQLLVAGSFDGVQGKVSIDETGDSGRVTILSTIRDGQFHVVK